MGRGEEGTGSGGVSGSGQVDCCSLQVRDRERGDDLSLGDGMLNGDAQYAGHWVLKHVFSFDPDTTAARFTNVATGATLQIDGHWALEAQLSESRLLLREIVVPSEPNSGTYVLDVTTPSLEWIDFPHPRYAEPVFPEGIAGLAVEPDARAGTLKLLPFDGGEIEVLAEEVDLEYERMQSGTIVYVDRPSDDDEAGTLVFVTRSGERHTIDTDVDDFQIPFHGTAREIDEVLYTVVDPERAGLWRFVLP